MPDPVPNQGLIISEFADDPDMRELVELFAQEMPAKIQNFQTALEGSRMDDLRRLAHQLKGSAGGYGFGVVGDAAGRLEHRLVSAGADPAAVLDQVRRDVEDLLTLCRNVRAHA